MFRTIKDRFDNIICIKKGSISVKILVYLFVLLLNGLIILYIEKTGKKYDDNNTNINNGWDIEYNGKKSKEVNLAQYEIKASINDTYVLEKEIKKTDLNDKIVKPAIYMECPFSHIVAYVDGKKVFDKEDKEYYVISFPREKLGKKVKIVITGIRKNSFERMSKVLIIDENFYITNVIEKEFFALMFTSFLIILALIILSLIALKHSIDMFNVRLFLIGLCILSIGAWFLGNSEVYYVVIDNNFLQNVFEFCSIYFGCPSLCAFLYTFLKKDKHKKVMKILLIESLVVAVAATTIDTIFKNDKNICLMIQETLMIAIILSGIVFIKREYDSLAYDEKKILTSFCVVGIGIGYETVRYIANMIFGENDKMSEAVGISSLIFVFMLAEAYFGYAKLYIDSNIEKTRLVNKAYKDILTGLDNRSRVMEEMANLKNNTDIEYTIINFDLNDLKIVNDTKGHIAGDTYLCTFSDTLKHYLENDFDIIGRVGGDEFVAISDSFISDKRIEKSIFRMNNHLKKICIDNEDIDISFAYGYVSSKKNKPLDVIKAYKMADEMMYECKKKQKANRLQK